MENNALLGTTHKLPNSNGLSSLQSSIVLPVGRPQNADVSSQEDCVIDGKAVKTLICTVWQHECAP